MPITDWLRQQLELDATSSVELGSQEQIIHVTGRHVIKLLKRDSISVLLLLFFSGFAGYRAIGGSFLVMLSDAPNGLDPFNWLLIGLVSLLALLWMALWVRGKPTLRTRSILLFTGTALSLLAYFRYNGGRLFVIDAKLFGGQGTDPFNLLLIFFAFLSLMSVVFIFYDWLNDQLIVTNQRVIFDDDTVIIPRLVEERVQRQIFLEDVQDVSAATKTYAEQWLGYGRIEIKSARFNGNITFEAARNPKQLQAAVMNQVRALRKATTTQDYGRLVAERVYGERTPAPPRPQLQLKQSKAWLWLHRIIPNNPEVNIERGEFTWHPHWLFLLRALVGPFTLLGCGVLIIVIGTRMAAFAPLWVLFASVLLILVWVGWSAWEIEDYRNDLYILTPDKVIDIEKKPFGPEERREAGLSQVNNVFSQTTYFSNFFGYGNVVLNTGGGGPSITFNRVPRPSEVVSLVTEYNIQAKRAEKYRPLNDTLELLKYYHEAQIQRDEINRPSA